MSVSFYEERILNIRIKKNSKGSTFLFGAALSQITDGVGIPNVEGVIEFIEEYAVEQEVDEVYFEEAKGFSEQDRYQQAFSLIAGLCGQESVNEIIRRIVESNIDESGRHRIPQAIKDFVTSIKNGNIIVNNIITTNFDTLLEEEFNNQDIPFNSFSVVADTQLPNDINGNINIYHLHGSWERGDSMHTTNQLQSNRDRIETSLQNLIGNQSLVVMGYGGWDDSFTRSLASAVINTQLKYNILWCFYEGNNAVIEQREAQLLNSLNDGISRGRIQLYKGIDCNKVFASLAQVSAIKKRQIEQRDIEQKRLETINYYNIPERHYNSQIRGRTRSKAIQTLTRHNSLFVKSPLGFGVYDFIYSLMSSASGKGSHCVRVNCSEVISQAQIEHQVLMDSGQSLSQLSYLLNLCEDDVHFIIFDKIRGDMDEEALTYLSNLPKNLNVLRKNVFFIFTSSIDIKLFGKVQVELKKLDRNDTQLILDNRFDKNSFTHAQISQIYEYSEGVVEKLELIMDYLNVSSVEEVLSDAEMFNDAFHAEHIPKTTMNQINLLFDEPSKEPVLRYLKILAILKNGETLTNIRKAEMGIGLHAKHTMELVRLELATTVQLDQDSKLVKINPIIKDYMMSKMTRAEILQISNEYLNVTLTQTKRGVKLSSINRKISQSGYNSEEDNTCTLLRNAFEECRDNIRHAEVVGESTELALRRMNKLCYLSGAYVYLLNSTSRFTETITAVDSLLNVIKEVDSDQLHRYYALMSNAYRMKSNYDEAKEYLDLCEKLCPESDKWTQNMIYRERLYLLESTDLDMAIKLAKSRKNDFHKQSVENIMTEAILAKRKPSDLRFQTLVKLEKKARKFGHITVANNILFTINREHTHSDKINNLNKAILSDQSEYNVCRAKIYKHQAHVEMGLFERIKDNDIGELLNIYDYLFRQKFDSLFNKCHQLLWEIAENRQLHDVIFLIFFKGTIVWRLNSDNENEIKYGTKIKEIPQPRLLEFQP
ncbi:TPA: SIR2 family protein [Vibrio parahaemolyticus]|nr:SIR2 family protein [Vibrio parahaemolyticus]